MRTGVSLSASERVQRLQTALHAKAKEVPGFRFYSLCDKVWARRRARGRLAGCASQRRRGRGGRRDGRGHRIVRSGPVAGSTGAGPEGGDLPARARCGRSSSRRSNAGSSGRWASPRSSRTAHRPTNEPSGWTEVTHPFHPLRGRRFPILKTRRVSGIETLILQGTSGGTFCVPREWTDREVPAVAAELVIGPHVLESLFTGVILRARR